MSSTTSAPPTQCKICDKEFKSPRALSTHIRFKHDISIAGYYGSYVDRSAHDCLTCGAPTKLISMTYGHQPYCSRICAQKDPETSKKKSITGSKTFAENPSIAVDRVTKCKATLAANPQIQLDQIEAMKNTINTPEFKAEKSKLLSVGRRNYYNNLRQSSSTMRYIIYLIAHSSLGVVKIGITLNLKKRIYDLKKDFGSIEIVKTVESTHDLVSVLEIKMHKYFKDKCMVQPQGRGRTEFFDIAITDEAITMLEEFESSIYPE